MWGTPEEFRSGERLFATSNQMSQAPQSGWLYTRKLKQQPVGVSLHNIYNFKPNCAAENVHKQAGNGATFLWVVLIAERSVIAAHINQALVP